MHKESKLAADDETDRLDRALLEQIASQKSRSALELLYKRYQPRLTGFLRRMTQDDGLIEEAYNDVMLKVWNKAGQYESRSKASSWIFSIAYRTCLRMVKKQKIRSGVIQLFAKDAESEKSVVDTSDDTELIEHALGVLSEKHRIAIELSYFQGYSTEEISQIADCPVNTVKTRLFNARKSLRKALDELSGEGKTA